VVGTGSGYTRAGPLRREKTMGVLLTVVVIVLIAAAVLWLLRRS
jgi:hypothetical protein